MMITSRISSSEVAFPSDDNTEKQADFPYNPYDPDEGYSPSREGEKKIFTL